VLILLRHGRTESNASGLLLGRGDPPLDAVGRQQVRAVADALGPVDRVVTSPLMRTRETASALGAPVTVDDRWIELDYGELEGTPVADVPIATWAAWRSDIDHVPAGGESIAQLGLRVREACGELHDEAVDRDIVVVSHVSPIKAAICWALAVGDEHTWRLFLSPASVSRIRVGSAGPVLVSCNEVLGRDR